MKVVNIISNLTNIRPQIKSFQVKIRVEDDVEKDKAMNKENKAINKTRGAENKSPKINNNRMAVKKKETKEIIPPKVS